MKNYEVFFEIYGKKMKVNVLADNENDVKYRVMGKIKFHKIIRKDSEFNKKLESLDDLFDLFDSFRVKK